MWVAADAHTCLSFSFFLEGNSVDPLFFVLTLHSATNLPQSRYLKLHRHRIPKLQTQKTTWSGICRLSPLSTPPILVMVYFQGFTRMEVCARTGASTAPLIIRAYGSQSSLHNPPHNYYFAPQSNIKMLSSNVKKREDGPWDWGVRRRITRVRCASSAAGSMR